MPQIILPEPPITFTMPTISKIGPEIKFEGSPNIIPQVGTAAGRQRHTQTWAVQCNSSCCHPVSKYPSMG